MLVNLHLDNHIQPAVRPRAVFTRNSGLVLTATVDLTSPDRKARVLWPGSRRIGLGRVREADLRPLSTTTTISRREQMILINLVRVERTATVPLAVIRRILRDDGKVSARHGDLVGLGGFVAVAWVFVKELQQCLVRLVVEVVDLVATGQQVGYRGRRGLVDDGRGDHVGDVAVVVFRRDVELGVRVEASQGGEMDVTAEDGDADGELGRQSLEALNEPVALFLVGAGGVVVVEVVEQIDAAVEAVEKAAAETDAAVEELDGGDDWGGEDVFEPGEARIGNGHTQQENQVLQRLVRVRGSSELLLETSKNGIIRLGIVDLVPRTFGASVKTNEGYPSTQPRIHIVRVLSNIWTWLQAVDIARLGDLGVDMGSHELVWIHALSFLTTSRMDRVGGVCRRRRREMVLEKHVVLVSDTTDASENIALHEVVDIRAKSVDNVVVIPDIDLGNLAIGSSKGLSAVPE